MPDTTQRIQRLEEQLYFQEESIKQLNQALTGQQFQLDSLQRRLELAEKRLAALLPLLDAGGEAGLPPHYSTSS